MKDEGIDDSVLISPKSAVFGEKPLSLLQFPLKPLRGIVIVVQVDLYLAVSILTELRELIQELGLILLYRIEPGMSGMISVRIGVFPGYFRIPLNPHVHPAPLNLVGRSVPFRFKVID